MQWIERRDFAMIFLIFQNPTVIFPIFYRYFNNL